MATSPVQVTQLPSPSPTAQSSSPASSSPPAAYCGPHVVLSLPRCTWKKGSIAEYVSKARVFFDSLHEAITLFTGSPVNKAWSCDKQSGSWQDFPVNLPPQNDILGAQLSPDKSMLAIRVSDKEVVSAHAASALCSARSRLQPGSPPLSLC